MNQRKVAVLSSCLMMMLMLLSGNSLAQEKDQLCLGCHDADVSHPIKAMLDSKHYHQSLSSAPVNNEGCQSCHGESATHASTPTRVQPEISFGPRWSSSVDAQNDTCLTCHESTTTHKQWREGMHADQDVTCVTCHDVHVDVDPVRVAQTQSQVCTVCHKVQKDGIHHMADKLDENPKCADCHNPHANPSPTVMMLENRSQGCRTCHDLQAMQANTTITEKAKSYHRVMQNDDRTCVDCHRGVAHVDRSNFGLIAAGGLSEMPIDLFFPAQSDGDWLLEEHEGAQALRQGRNCRQCHLGEAKQMGESLAPAGITPSINANVALKQVGANMELTVTWQGSVNDNSVALMFDNGQVMDFGKQGCWAACHSDMPGMTRDRGQDLNKYLLISQSQQRSVGRPSVLHDNQTLAEMMNSGQFVELWKVDLQQGKVSGVSSSSILASRELLTDGSMTARGAFNNGTWTVTFVRPMDDSRKPISADQQMTFGIAIHSDGESAAQHRVSLPMTISLDGQDTDFVLN